MDTRKATPAPDPAALAAGPALAASVRAVRALYGAAACSVAAVVDGALLFVAADGEGAGVIVGTSMPLASGLAGWVATSGQPVGVADVRADPRFARDVAASTGYVPTTILAAPLVTGDGVVGVIEVLDPTPRPDGLALLETLAVPVAAVWTQALAASGAGGDARAGDGPRRLMTVIEAVGDDPELAARVADLLEAVVALPSGGRR